MRVIPLFALLWFAIYVYVLEKAIRIVTESESGDSMRKSRGKPNA